MRYLKRALKYFFVLIVILLAINLLIGDSIFLELSIVDALKAMASSERHIKLFAVIVILSALYPLFGYVKRRVVGSVDENRDQIIAAFDSVGFHLVREEDGVLYFRASNVVHRALLIFEDEIKVWQSGDEIVLDGIRRGVARVNYRIDMYITNSKYD